MRIVLHRGHVVSPKGMRDLYIPMYTRGTLGRMIGLIGNPLSLTGNVALKSFKRGVLFTKRPNMPKSDFTYYDSAKWGSFSLCNEGLKVMFENKIPRRLYIEILEGGS